MQWSVRSPAAVTAGVAVILIALGAALWWLLADNREVLFERLDAAQLNAIGAELDRAGISYRIDREKSAISVTSQDARRARLTVLASGNALRDSVGFELFDKSDFGVTDFAQKINYQRALEGEIARTVSALANIKYTRVHLVLPEHGLFQSDKQQPRASVTVFLDRENALSEDRVRGIQRIVASAVAELPEQNVTVINQNGTILSSAVVEDGKAVPASTRLAQKQAVENYLQEKLQRVLQPAVGGNRFAVSVDVSLDLNQKTVTTEKVLEAPANVGVKRLKESSNRSKGENGNDDLLREVEYAVGHESEQIVYSGGDIRRLQIGVVVDQSADPVDTDKLRELVAAAAGVDSARGDKVTVVQKAFAAAQDAAAPQNPPAPVAAIATVAAVDDFFLMALFGGGLLIGIVLTALWLRRRARQLDERQALRLRQELQHWLAAESVEADVP